MTTEVEPQALTLDDHVQIQQLYARYAFAIDLRQTDAWLECWTQDGELGRAEADDGSPTSPILRGHAALRQMAESVAGSGVAPGYHWNSNLLVEPTTDGARGRCYFMLVKAPEGPVQVTIVGYMKDELVKVDGRWLFRRRRMHSL